MSSALVISLLALGPLAAAYAPGLEVAFSLERATQGISISPEGRKFLSQRYSTTAPPQAVELLSDNTTVLYPDAAWNSYNVVYHRVAHIIEWRTFSYLIALKYSKTPI